MVSNTLTSQATSKFDKADKSISSVLPYLVYDMSIYPIVHKGRPRRDEAWAWDGRAVCKKATEERWALPELVSEVVPEHIVTAG
jgi:hypothetical protein